jgi:lysine-N-methylase
MSLPVRHLPVIQNWDCHVCGSCCKEYVVTVSDEERRRIEAQDWKDDPVVGGLPLFKKRGPWWARRYSLNHRSDGSCVFLSEEGRCRIHEKFGYETKPLPCRLFPFVLAPAGDHWRVGMRYACPSAAENKGRNVLGHGERLKEFAAELAHREGLRIGADGYQLGTPALQGRQRFDWPDLLRLVDAVLQTLQNKEDTLERRWRKCLALSNLCRQARLDKLKGKRLSEFLTIVMASLNAEVPADPSAVKPPKWLGRILFRQAVAIFSRKDHGPDRGIARNGRLALLGAAWRFSRGTGPVPRLHNRIPETTFDEIERASTPMTAEAREVLERYYTVKVGSVQFFGAPNLHLPFWEGLELLALTYPIICWVTRAMSKELPPSQAVARALTIVDDHFGYNRVLRSRRQRTGLSILARTGELSKLVAWYGREKQGVGNRE